MALQENRTNSAIAKVVDQGIEWQRTYGSRSAAAFLAYRDIPRSIIQRVVRGEDTCTVRAASPTDG